MVPILMNKDVFEPSYSDLKFTVQNHNYCCTNLINHFKTLTAKVTIDCYVSRLCELTGMSGSPSESLMKLQPHTISAGATAAPGLAGLEVFWGPLTWATATVAQLGYWPTWASPRDLDFPQPGGQVSREHCSCERFQGQETEAARPVKVCAWNSDSRIPQPLMDESSHGAYPDSQGVVKWTAPPDGSRKVTPHWNARGAGLTAIVSHFWNTRSTTHSFVINLQWSYPAADKFPFSHCYSVLNWAQSNIQFIPPNICQGYICSLNCYQSIPFYTFKGYSIFFVTWTFYFLLGSDHEFEQTPEDSGEQRSLGGYSPWGHKDTT